jgi:TonB family protein
LLRAALAQQVCCMTDEPEQNSNASPVSVPASDRRAHPRQRIRSLAYVHLGESNGGIVLNISEGGIAVQAAEALDAGESPLAMRIEIPRSRKRLEVRGEIVWVGESRKEAGLRFVDLAEDALRRIRAWMAREESPGTAPEESEEEVEAPVVRAAEAHTETVVTAQDFSDRGERVAEAEEFATDDGEEFRETEEPAEREEESVEFAAESADEPAEVSDEEPVAEAEDADVAMEAPSHETKETVAPAVAARKEEDRALTIAPPALTYEKKPQTPNSPYTPISGTHGAPAFAVAAAPPAPVRYVTSEAATPLFPQPRVSAEPAAAHTGWKSFRVQLQSGWFLAALVLLLATISFIAGMAVRRGALNGMMGDADDGVQPKSAPAPSSGNLTGNSAPNPSGNGSGATAVTAPAKPLQIEIVDLENHRWTIPAASGTNHGDASVARQTQADDAVAPPQGASPAPSGSNLPNQNSGQGASSNGGAAGAKAGAPLMLSLPETPISASGSIAIRATGMVALPAGDAQSAQHARNLQIGELVNLVEPVYPPDARQARLEGTVKLHVVVGADGEIQSFRTISGPESLAQAAMIAVREWRYRPTLLNGKAVEMQEDVTFVFRLPN